LLEKQNITSNNVTSQQSVFIVWCALEESKCIDKYENKLTVFEGFLKIYLRKVTKCRIKFFSLDLKSDFQNVVTCDDKLKQTGKTPLFACWYCRGKEKAPSTTFSYKR